MSENLANAAAELQKQMKMVKERNENIIKAHNSGLSTEGILEQFDINQETLDSVLKSAKRNGLLKSPVMEENKPRRGRPPGKPQEESKPLLKESEVKPNRGKRPRKEAIEENLEKVSPEVKEVIKSFAPEKKEEPVVENSIDVNKYIGEDHSKTISDIFPAALEHVGEIAASIAEISKSHVPKMDISKVPDLTMDTLETSKSNPFLKPAVEKQVNELKGQLEPTSVNELDEGYSQLLKDELKFMAAVMEEKDLEIAKLKEQVKRFDFLETLAIELMRNTIALVDQAEEKRLEGRQ